MFNQRWYTLPLQAKLNDLLILANIQESHFALALNDQLIPKCDYPTQILKDKDVVDLIVPMQGG